ncbi:MAG TPA: short-chain dehydrogenase/reductase [Pseudonocardiaceae bacterium]
MFDVRDKVVLVTGAASGIGAATAALLHRRGARVALLDIDETAMKDEHALAIGADVRDRTAMARAVDSVAAHFGRLDVVVANAGIAPDPATVRTIEPAAFDRVIDINLTGVFNTVQPALDQIIRNHGHVLVVSSAAAFAPGAGLAAYMASKAAVEQLGRALRIELAAVGASAGVAYFGFVRTPLLRPIDEDPLGRTVDALLPWPFSQRITAERAAEVIANSIARRAATGFAPPAWQVYGMLRGLVNVVVDGRAAASATVHGLIRAIEARVDDHA